jgi:hypothetical protein
MDKSLDALKAESPLISWLMPKVPVLIQSSILSALIIWLTSMFFNTDKVFQLAIPLFIILTVITNFAPNALNGLQYGLGFAIAAVIFKFSFKDKLLKAN